MFDDLQNVKSVLLDFGMHTCGLNSLFGQWVYILGQFFEVFQSPSYLVFKIPIVYFIGFVKVKWNDVNETR